jgi:SAM-dependent methyltransferase
MAEPVTYGDAFFRGLDEGARRAAEAVVPIVLSSVPVASVVDVGCGSGAWLSVFRAHGIEDFWGLDGPWNTVAPVHLGERFRHVDLRGKVRVPRTFDLAVSIEVAEHLPPWRAKGFVGELTALSDAVLFSAAIPGQGGEGHENEAWPSHWAALFRAEGFVPVDVIRPALWDQVEVPIAVRQNALLYLRATTDQHSPEVLTYLDIVHPQWVAVLRGQIDRPGFRAWLRAAPGVASRAVTRLVRLLGAALSSARRP